MSYEPNTKEENAVQREAFEFYYSKGAERSYAKVALKFQKSVSTIENWGRDFKWKARVEERESLKRKAAQEQAIVEKETDYIQRDLRIVRRAILEHAKAIQNGEIKPSYPNLVKLMDLEQRLVTGVDSRMEVNHKVELRGLTNEEIEKRIEERVQKLLKYKNMKKFDELEDPIEASYQEVRDEGDKCLENMNTLPEN